MGQARAHMDVPGTVEDAEELWYDVSRWATFIDGFGHLHRRDEEWPATGATLVWDSLPNGRGRVVERVVAQAPGDGQTVQVEDPRLRGTQRIGFMALEDGVAVMLELEYGLKQGSIMRPLTDALFIRRAIRESLRRTLVRFDRELRAEGELR